MIHTRVQEVLLLSKKKKKMKTNKKRKKEKENQLHQRKVVFRSYIYIYISPLLRHKKYLPRDYTKDHIVNNI